MYATECDARPNIACVDITSDLLSCDEITHNQT